MEPLLSHTNRTRIQDQNTSSFGSTAVCSCCGQQISSAIDDHNNQRMWLWGRQTAMLITTIFTTALPRCIAWGVNKVTQNGNPLHMKMHMHMIQCKCRYICNYGYAKSTCTIGTLHLQRHNTNYKPLRPERGLQPQHPTQLRLRPANRTPTACWSAWGKPQ
jgi:hypothetical protein